MNQDIIVSRKIFSDLSTIGVLRMDQEGFECFTLEDVERHGPKVYGVTAIPRGRYRVALTYSEKYGHVMPIILGVPGFHGVRIHRGNTPADTEGCILLGKSVAGEDKILGSKLAYAEFCELLCSRLQIDPEQFLVIRAEPDDFEP